MLDNLPAQNPLPEKGNFEEKMIGEYVQPIKNPFPVVKFIIVILVLAAIGVSGYLAYIYSIAPQLNSYSALIPDDLKAYDLGKNADGFLVYKIDQNLDGLYQQIPAIKQANQVKNAIAYFSENQQSAAAVVEFDSSISAKLATTALNQQKSTLGIFPAFTIEQKDNLMILGFGKGLAAFQGSILENPDIKNIDPTLANSQLIVFLNHDKSPSSLGTVFSIINMIANARGSTMNLTSMDKTSSNEIIPSAHAQGFFSVSDNPTVISAGTSKAAPLQSALTAFNGTLSFAKNTTIIVGYKNQAVHAQISTNLLSRDDLAKSNVLKFMQTVHSSATIADVQKSYDGMMMEINKELPTIQESFKQVTANLPTSQATLNFDQKSFQVSVNISQSDLQSLIQQIMSQAQNNLSSQLKAPQKARNAKRIADVSNIVNALGDYYHAKKHDPETSDCIENILDASYFYNKKIPSDTQGPQTFGSKICQSGYYYQVVEKGKIFIDNGSLVWAKMENHQGNTDETPDNIVQTEIANKSYFGNLNKSRQGDYYVMESAILEIINKPSQQ